jgi:hypothetical protein
MESAGLSSSDFSVVSTAGLPQSCSAQLLLLGKEVTSGLGATLAEVGG